MPAVDPRECLEGRVLRVQRLGCVVETTDGRQFRCVIRQLLRSLSTDGRHIVAPGDRVWIKPAFGDEGFVERIEPRHGVLSRASKGRAHVIVSNVDQVVFVLSLVEPDLALRVREVSDVNQKGKHTTTTAALIRLDFGGWVVDTPGVRQFGLWDVIPEEVEGFFPEMRPLVPLCAFPDCTHTHEERCAVKRAVFRRQVSASRYTSYLGMISGEGVS